MPNLIFCLIFYYHSQRKSMVPGETASNPFPIILHNQVLWYQQIEPGWSLIQRLPVTGWPKTCGEGWHSTWTTWSMRESWMTSLGAYLKLIPFLSYRKRKSKSWIFNVCFQLHLEDRKRKNKTEKVTRTAWPSFLLDMCLAWTHWMRNRKAQSSWMVRHSLQRSRWPCGGGDWTAHPKSSNWGRSLTKWALGTGS